MISVIWADNTASEESVLFLAEHLAKFFRVTAILNGSISQSGHGEELILYKAEQISSCNVRPCIVLVPPASTSKIGKIFDSNTLFVLSSEQKKLLRTMVKLKLRTITCGASPKDSITFSSKNEDELVVSLQRSIVNFKGETIEPFELPIKGILSVEDFAVMAYTAILTETGLIDKN